MVRVFEEITSKANNVSSSPYREKCKTPTVRNRYSIHEDVSTMAESVDSLSQKESSELEDDEYSYASKSQSSYPNEFSSDDDDFSSEYSSDDTDESDLSYRSSRSSDSSESDEEEESVNTKFLKDVKKRTKKVETEYRNTTERRLRAIHLVACRHLRVSDLFNTKMI